MGPHIASKFQHNTVSGRKIIQNSVNWSIFVVLKSDTLFLKSLSPPLDNPFTYQKPSNGSKAEPQSLV